MLAVRGAVRGRAGSRLRPRLRAEYQHSSARYPGHHRDEGVEHRVKHPRSEPVSPWLPPGGGLPGGFACRILVLLLP